MYLWSRQQKGLRQAIQDPQWQISGDLIQNPCEQGMSSKIRMEHWCSHYWSNHQKSDIVEKHTSIVRLTSLLVVTLPKFTLKSFAFSDACKSYSFLCNASRNVVEVQTIHGHSKHSGKSGLGLVTFLQTTSACTLGINNTCRVVDIKTSKPGLLWKASHHWTSFLYWQKSMFHQDFALFQFTLCAQFLHCDKHVAYCWPMRFQCHQPNLCNKTQAYCPRMESLKNFSSYVYIATRVGHSFATHMDLCWV